jgi:transposase
LVEAARQNPEKLKVFYMDEASFYRQPTQAWLWAERGRTQPRLRWSYRSNTVVRVAAALEVVEGRVVYRLAPRISTRELVRYYEQLVEAYPDCPRLYVVQDNWPNHTHPDVRRAVERLERLELVFLPTYAPYLNPEEKVWRWTKQRLVHAHPYCDDFNEFKRQIAAPLDDANEHCQDLRRYCGLQDKI